MTTRVGIIALEGFTDSGLSVALDVFRAANALARRGGARAPFTVKVVSPSRRGVRSAAGMRLSNPEPMAALDDAQVVLVPGCWAEVPADLEAFLEGRDAALAIAALDRAAARRALVGTSCSGSFLMASTGRLAGLAATTTWWLAGLFRERFPDVRLEIQRALVVEGRLFSAGTVFAMADLALAIVARRAGPTLAQGCMQALLLDEHPSQAPYMVLRQIATNEPLLRSAERWVRAHLADEVSVEALARGIGTSPRTLARRLEAALGMGPRGFVQHLRLEVASHLLEASRLSVEEVAARVGYRDAGTLRRFLQRTVGHGPRELRRRAGGSR